MARFRNCNDITKYYQNLVNTGRVDELKSSLSKADTEGFSIELVSEKELTEAANALKGYLQNFLKQYFDSYDPKIYERTGGLLNSIIVDVVQNGDKLQARLTFDPTSITGKSVFEGGSDGDKVLLLDQGWQVTKDVWFKDIEHFGFFDGIGFIKNAVDSALSDPRFTNIEIEVSESLMY